MHPKDRGDNGEDLFRSRLDNIINPRHELVKLGAAIDWPRFDESFGAVYTDRGRPALPTRLMAGLNILKYMYGLSDPEVCARWVENPYYQHFCGEIYFCHEAPFERSSLTRWRQRLGEDKLSELIKESLAAAHREGALRLGHVKRVTVDTTVQPKNIAFPTDAKLLYTAIVRLGRLCRRHGIRLRQTYVRVGKLALIKAQRYAHAKQFKRHRREVKFLNIRLGRMIRDIHRKIATDASLRDLFEPELSLAGRLRRQKKRQDNPKVYSLHAPETECIGKGKAHKPYEFGCKVSIATTNARSPGGVFILHAKALHGSPYDGHTLKAVIEELTEWIGTAPERIYVDKGYRGHDAPKPLAVFRSGQKRGVHGQIKRELRRRSAVEPVIGHLKEEHRLGRNYLKGRDGDRTNAVLAAAGLNFRRLAQWLKILLLKILAALSHAKTPQPA
ncbi:MAG: IS5 family transposase [Hellea sp.]|nr:IS5 family transposase [Hellea sp.]